MKHLTTEQRKQFNKMKRQLVEPDEITLNLVVELVTIQSEIETLRAVIDEDGQTIKQQGDKGQQRHVVHPAQKQLNEYIKIMVSISKSIDSSQATKKAQIFKEEKLKAELGLWDE